MHAKLATAILVSLLLPAFAPTTQAEVPTDNPTSRQYKLTYEAYTASGAAPCSIPADNWCLGTGQGTLAAGSSGSNYVNANPAGGVAWQINDGGAVYAAAMPNNGASVNLCTPGQSMKHDFLVPSLATGNTVEYRITTGGAPVTSPRPANSIGISVIRSGFTANDAVTFYVAGATGTPGASTAPITITGGTQHSILVNTVQCGATARATFSIDGGTATVVSAASGVAITGILKQYEVASVGASPLGAASIYSDNYDWNGVPYPAPNPTAITPNTGETTGGQAIAVTGTNFRNGATITIGGQPATSVTYVNAGKLTAITPPHAAGVTNVVVTNPDGITGTLTSGFTYSPITITTLSPGSAGISKATVVTITGTGYQTGLTVMVGTVAATEVAVVSPTKITIKTPPLAMGAYPLTVTNPDSTSATKNFVVGQLCPGSTTQFVGLEDYESFLGGQTPASCWYTRSGPGVVLAGGAGYNSLVADTVQVNTKYTLASLPAPCPRTRNPTPVTFSVDMKYTNTGVGGANFYIGPYNTITPYNAQYNNIGVQAESEGGLWHTIVNGYNYGSFGIPLVANNWYHLSIKPDCFEEATGIAKASEYACVQDLTAGTAKVCIQTGTSAMGGSPDPTGIFFQGNYGCGNNGCFTNPPTAYIDNLQVDGVASTTGSSAHVNVNQLVGFDVDDDGNTVIVRADGGTTVKSFEATSLALTGTVSTPACNVLDGVSATHATFPDIDGQIQSGEFLTWFSCDTTTYPALDTNPNHAYGNRIALNIGNQYLGAPDYQNGCIKDSENFCEQPICSTSTLPDASCPDNSHSCAGFCNYDVISLPPKLQQLDKLQSARWDWSTYVRTSEQQCDAAGAGTQGWIPGTQCPDYTILSWAYADTAGNVGIIGDVQQRNNGDDGTYRSLGAGPQVDQMCTYARYSGGPLYDPTNPTAVSISNQQATKIVDRIVAADSIGNTYVAIGGVKAIINPQFDREGRGFWLAKPSISQEGSYSGAVSHAVAAACDNQDDHFVAQDSFALINCNSGSCLVNIVTGSGTGRGTIIGQGIPVGAPQTRGLAFRNVGRPPEATQDEIFLAYIDGANIKIYNTMTSTATCTLALPGGTFRAMEMSRSAKNLWVATSTGVDRYALDGCTDDRLSDSTHFTTTGAVANIGTDGSIDPDGDGCSSFCEQNQDDGAAGQHSITGLGTGGRGASTDITANSSGWTKFTGFAIPGWLCDLLGILMILLGALTPMIVALIGGRGVGFHVTVSPVAAGIGAYVGFGVGWYMFCIPTLMVIVAVLGGLLSVSLAIKNGLKGQ